MKYLIYICIAFMVGLLLHALLDGLDNSIRPDYAMRNPPCVFQPKSKFTQDVVDKSRMIAVTTPGGILIEIKYNDALKKWQVVPPKPINPPPSTSTPSTVVSISTATCSFSSWGSYSLMSADDPHEVRRSELWQALRTRVLTDEEMKEATKYGDGLNINVNIPYYELEKQQELNAAFVTQNLLKLQEIAFKAANKPSIPPQQSAPLPSWTVVCDGNGHWSYTMTNGILTTHLFDNFQDAKDNMDDFGDWLKSRKKINMDSFHWQPCEEIKPLQSPKPYMLDRWHGEGELK